MSVQRCEIHCHELEEEGQSIVESTKNGLKKRAGEFWLKGKGPRIKKGTENRSILSTFCLMSDRNDLSIFLFL